MEDLSEDELFVAELTLISMPNNQPSNLHTIMDYMLQPKREIYSDEKYFKLRDIILISKSKSKIRRYLLENDFIEQVDNYPKDELTEKGKKVKELGGFELYAEWESKEKDKEAKGEIPKRNALIYDALKMFITLIAGILIGKYGCNQPTKENAAPNNTPPLKQDTTIKISQPPHKILDSADSVY